MPVRALRGNSAKQRRRHRLLAWRLESLVEPSAELLAASLSVEAFPRDESVPHWLDVALTEFRKLRADARIAACRAFMGR